MENSGKQWKALEFSALCRSKAFEGDFASAKLIKFESFSIEIMQAAEFEFG